MKKKLLAIALCMCTVFSVAGCSDKDSKKKEEKADDIEKLKLLAKKQLSNENNSKIKFSRLFYSFMQ